MSLKMEFRMGEKSLSPQENTWTELVARTSQGLSAPAYIAPQDIELLSNVVGKVLGKESMTLMNNRKILEQSSFHGAYLLDSQWVEYFHDVPVEKLPELCAAWCREIHELFPDTDIQPDEELETFVKDLRSLCQQALEQEKTLMQTWSFEK